MVLYWNKGNKVIKALLGKFTKLIRYLIQKNNKLIWCNAMWNKLINQFGKAKIGQNHVAQQYCFFIGLAVVLLGVQCTVKKRQFKNIFYYNEQTGIQSLDPAFAKNQSVMWAVHQLYNTLVEVDDSLKVKPSVAKSWTISDDRKTILFYLRSDVFFHKNDAFVTNRTRKLTAHDVAYSLHRIIDPKVASSGAWIFNGRVDTLAPFTALNDSVFQLKLLQPFQPILGILTMQYCSIVPKEVVEKYGKDFRSHPCGTGPFELETWEEGMALTMIKNKQYFEKDNDGNQLPFLDAIKVSFYDSKATEFLLFQQGKLSFINDIDPSFKDEVLTKRGVLKPQWEQKIALKKSPYLNIEYLGILMDTASITYQTSPLRKKQLRQAINYGFDREKMMLYLRNSIGTAATSGMVPKGLPSFDSAVVKGYHYNPVLAKQLVQQSGYKGEVIELSTIPIYQDLATYIAKELESIGVKIKIDVMQKALLLEKTSKQQALLFRGSWIADYPDPENYLTLFYSKNPSPPNYTRYNNTAFDKLYEAAMLETNDEKRISLYQQMDNMVMSDAPIVPLWYDMAIHMVQPNLKGFSPNPLNLLELRKAKF
jgi:peptide/nickel transport system substrate-binding protein